MKSVAHVPLNVVKSHLLVGDRIVVVDSGTPGGEGRILEAVTASGRAATDISLILISHTHVDHAGSAAALRRLTGAPIALDPRELRYAEGIEPCPRTPTGLPGRLFGYTPLPRRRIEPFTPDVLVEDDFDLRGYGVEADVMRTAGHTPGSLSVHAPGTGELLAVDLLAGGVFIGGVARHGHVIEPPFHEDPAGVLEAVGRLLGLEPLTKIHVCHGGPLAPSDVAAWVRRRSRPE